MKTAAVIFIIGLFFGGCAALAPSFEQSHQVFIEQTIDNLDIAGTIGDRIMRNAKVALLPLEPIPGSALPINAVVEDQIIQTLLNRGYRVYERDSHAVLHLVREGKNKTYTFVTPPLPNVEAGEAGLLATQLKSVDYILSYRVLECGIMLYAYGDDMPKRPKVKSGSVLREGLVKIHIRVENTLDGEIVLAKNALGRKYDELPAELVPNLNNFHYSFIPYAYPELHNSQVNH